MWMAMIIFLSILSIYDIRSRQIPVALLLVGSTFAVLYAVLNIFGQKGTLVECAAALVPGVILLLLAFLTQKIGYADGWLVAIMGLLLGYHQCVEVFFISLFLSGITGLVLLTIKKASGKTKIPYVPFITIALMLAKII